uniref:Ig-like domain-containing protein n=1 Tax=Seriola lalandi dorsalis TaxID=1841481 RepID=A0A3B4XN42_SERLL
SAPPSAAVLESKRQETKGTMEDKKLIISFHPLAAPVIFTKELESLAANEGDSVTLHCELSKACVPLEWRKGELGLCPCAKYEIRETGKVAQLVIHNVEPEDSGSYTCDTGDHQSTAQLAVKGMPMKLSRWPAPSLNPRPLSPGSETTWPSKQNDASSKKKKKESLFPFDQIEDWTKIGLK